MTNKKPCGPLRPQDCTCREWISVEERWPEVNHGHFLCACRYRDCSGEYIVEVRFWDGQKFRATDSYIVTHWMPMPEPPPREPKGYRCLYCQKAIKPEWFNYFTMSLWGELKCPHCERLMKVESKLVKVGSTDGTD